MSTYDSQLNWISSQQRFMLERLKQWACINTFSWNGKGLDQLTALICKQFERLGGEISLIDLPPQRVLGDDHFFYSKPLAPALVIKKRTKAPIQVLLAGHLDTVYPPNSPFQSVTEPIPGTWIGPGVADMKGGIAILLTALEALERSPFAEQIGWEVILTPDEEIGSPGSAELYRKAASRHHCALIFEPSFSDGAFVSERKGSATFTLAVWGKGAHAGRDYSKGRSAVFPLARIINNLNSLRENSDLLVNVADLEGEGPVNIIPPFASCRINIRSCEAKMLDEVVKNLYQFVEEAQEEGITIELVQDSLRQPKPFNDQTKILFDCYSRCAKELDIPFHLRPSGGVCDGNILAGEGLPTLDTAGAIGGSLHTPEEYIICSSLSERAQLTALFLFKLSAQEFASSFFRDRTHHGK